MADTKEDEQSDSSNRRTSHVAVDVNESTTLNTTENNLTSTENKIMQSITLSIQKNNKTEQKIRPIADSFESEFDDDDEQKTYFISRSNVISNIAPFQVETDDNKMEKDIPQQSKYSKKPCLRFILNIFGWIIWGISWFFLFLFCFILGPILFLIIKSRYIWHNTIWESLIAHTLTEDDALYLLKQFPFPWFFTHAGPSYTSSTNILIIIFKILYVIFPQSIIFGFYTFWWLLRRNYLQIKTKYIHRTQFDIMIKFFKWIFKSPLSHTFRRSLSSFFFVLDVSTDVIIMLKLYNGEEKYWFSLTFGSILASYFVPWARSITYVKEYIVKSNDKRCYKRIMRNIAGLFLIPWFGIFVVFFVDIYLIINILLDWLRLLFRGTKRNETEEELSYRRLRTLTELMCESIPQLMIQYYILKTYEKKNEEEKINNLGLSEFDLYRSMIASSTNLIFQIICLYFESKQYYSSNSDITFFQYLFISMEGKFGLNTKLLSISCNNESCIDLSNIEFKSDPYLISNFFQATSDAFKANYNNINKRQKFVISPRTLNGIEDDMIFKLAKHCKEYNIELLINCNWKQWYISQLSNEYCLDVIHDKIEPLHTSLTYAITMDGYDGYDYVSRLLKTGCNPNRPNRQTDTPLLLSVALKKLDYSKILLKNGAKVNELNSQNKTALFHACARREIDLIEVLLNHNIDVFQQDNEFGNTCLVETAFTMKEMVQLILEHKNVEKQEKKHNTKLVNVANNKGETALVKAANFGLLHVVQLLVQNGANLNHQDFRGNTVLHKVRSVPILQFLLKVGANVNIVNHKQQTAIFGVIRNNAFTLLPIFKKNENNQNKIDDNHCDIDGNTIFHYLAKGKGWKFIYSLISHHGFHQIDVNLKNKQNLSLIDMINEQHLEKDNQSQQYVDFFMALSNKQKSNDADEIP